MRFIFALSSGLKPLSLLSVTQTPLFVATFLISTVSVAVITSYAVSTAPRVQTAFVSLLNSQEVFAIPGNHDIGYGSSLTPKRLKRFENAFGYANNMHEAGRFLLVFANSMAFDMTQYSEQQADTWKFLESAAEVAKEKNLVPVLFSHIPIFPNKTIEGCDDVVIKTRNNGVVDEQTHITEESTQRLIEVLKPFLVVSGHDHSGCMYGMEDQDDVPNVVVRSIMGDFGGNVGLLSLKDVDGVPQFAYETCPLYLKMTHCVAIVAYALFTLTVGMVRSCCCQQVRKTKSE